MRRLGTSFTIATLALSALPLMGCQTSCDDYDSTPRPFSDGIVNSKRTEYQTSTWDGTYLEFGPGRVYELKHGLKTIPTQIKTYLGFVDRPLPSGGTGVVAESAGNQAEITSVTPELIRIRNSTCAQFYLRLVASLSDDAEEAE
jgi:hypothetical protein